MVFTLGGMIMDERRVQATTSMENHLAFGNNGMKMGLESMKNTIKMECLMVVLPVSMIMVELEKKL